MKYIIEDAFENRGFWLPGGLGYTKNKAEAGRFSWEELGQMNLDGCILWKVQPWEQ